MSCCIIIIILILIILIIPVVVVFFVNFFVFECTASATRGTLSPGSLGHDRGCCGRDTTAFATAFAVAIIIREKEICISISVPIIHSTLSVNINISIIDQLPIITPITTFTTTTASIPQFQLTTPQTMIRPTNPTNQLIMNPGLRDPPILHHKNLIRAENRTEAMRNDKRRLTTTNIRQRTLDRRLGDAVDITGRLVQQQDVGFLFQDRTRDR